MICYYYVITAVTAYLIGSVNTGVIISRRLFKTDVRSSGSGNAGATNIARVFGMLPGILVLVLDAMKAAISCFLGWKLCGGTGICIAGIACNLGHCFPCYFGFKGGKGVSVSVMLAAVIDWRIFLILFSVFMLTFLISHTVSLCSVVSALVLIVAAFVLRLPLYDIVLSCFTGAFVIFQHRSNIVRLIRGTEAKFEPKRQEKS